MNIVLSSSFLRTLLDKKGYNIDTCFMSLLFKGSYSSLLDVIKLSPSLRVA